MSSVNQRKPIYNAAGGVASYANPEETLRRSVMACLLWEDSFYEDGESITKRVSDLIPKVDPEKCRTIIIEAKEESRLRHMPLFMIREMLRHPQHKALCKELIARVCTRPDDMTELLALYWKEKKQPLSAVLKKGLANAFVKFDEYQLAKYNRDGAIRLRDVLFMCHARPLDKAQEKLWTKLIDGKLATPDTWEVALSAGADKKETFERLMEDKKLGALAFLRNLRNMLQAGVSESRIKKYLEDVDTSWINPFQFITAARFAPAIEPELEAKLFEATTGQRFKGTTVILVDVSGSMDDALSAKSEVRRIDVACGLAMILREQCENPKIFTFSNSLAELAARRGFSLRDAIVHSQPHSGTEMGGAIDMLNRLPYDRIIVITDEQAQDRVPAPKGKGYIINVAPYQMGVGYGNWTHVNGWSENVIRYIAEVEKDDHGQ